MGFTPVIFAFVVAFLAGTAASPIKVLFVGIGISLVEQCSSIWLEARWTQTAVFVILLVYLVALSIDLHPFRGPAAAPQAHRRRGGVGGVMQLWMNYLDQILIFVVFALSLNLLLGYAGQVSVGHAAFGASRRLHRSGTWSCRTGLELHPGVAGRHRSLAAVVGGVLALAAAEALRRVPHLVDAGRVVGDHRRAARRSPNWAAATG